MHEPTLTCTCLNCGALTDAPFCEACEALIEPLTVEATDALYAEHQRRESTRQQREANGKH